MNKTKNNAHIVTFLYWFILLIWQNVRSVGNRGGIDVLIKGGIILFLTGYYVYKSKKIRTFPLLFATLYAILALDIFISSGTTFTNFLAYFYPVVLYLLVYGVGSTFEITRKQLIFILDFLVICVAYIAIYAVLFCREQFSSAFSISTAYGNELKSFLVSNFEYGMYLSFGIISSILCLEFKQGCKGILKLLYVLAIILFAVNLVLTFSRTSIIICILMLIIYAIFFKKGKLKYALVLFAVLMVVLWFAVPEFQSFISEIVFKNNTDSGRNELANLGLQMFKEGSLYNQLFGIPGYVDIITDNLKHSNLHSGYLQILVMNGVKGVVAFVCIMLYELKQNFKLIKEYPEYKNLAILFIGFDISVCVVMSVTTCVLFYSSIDSYFLTMMAIIIPKFVRNSIIAGTFENE